MQNLTHGYITFGDRKKNCSQMHKRQGMSGFHFGGGGGGGQSPPNLGGGSGTGLN